MPATCTFAPSALISGAMARRDSFIDHLQDVALFSACSRKDLQMVARRAEDVRVPAGKVLVTEGETGHEFFVILDGTAKVTRQGRRIATLGPGQAFGELALLTDAGIRSARVRAKTEGRCWAIPRADFVDLIHREPSVAVHLLAVLAQRLADTLP